MQWQGRIYKGILCQYKRNKNAVESILPSLSVLRVNLSFQFVHLFLTRLISSPHFFILVGCLEGVLKLFLTSAILLWAKCSLSLLVASFSRSKVWISTNSSFWRSNSFWFRFSCDPDTEYENLKLIERRLEGWTYLAHASSAKSIAESGSRPNVRYGWANVAAATQMRAPSMIHTPWCTSYFSCMPIL